MGSALWLAEVKAKKQKKRKKICVIREFWQQMCEKPFSRRLRFKEPSNSLFAAEVMGTASGTPLQGLSQKQGSWEADCSFWGIPTSFGSQTPLKT